MEISSAPWGQHTEELKTLISDYPIISIRQVAIMAFGGHSLSAIRTAKTVSNDQETPKGVALLSWWQPKGCTIHLHQKSNYL